jgi:hypothetical protein
MRTLILLIALTFTTLAKAGGESLVVVKQELFTTQKITLNLNKSFFRDDMFRTREFHYGHGMMIGGSAMALAGFLTPRSYVGLNGPARQSFFQDTGRAAAIITGLTVLTGGIVVTISI